MAKYPVYFGTYSKGEGKGLLRGMFDDDTGALSLRDSIDIENPSYLLLSSDEKILYGVSEMDSFQGERGGALFAVSLEEDAMRLLSMACTHGASPCHLCIHDTYVFVANYSEGSLSLFEKTEEGGLTACRHGIQHYGKSVNSARQEKAHVHFAAMTPEGEYLVLCDLGMDQVVFYPYDREKGLSMNAWRLACPGGSGPRHLVFSQDGCFLYVVTELKNTVLVYAYHHGEGLSKTTFLQEISTLPSGFEDASTAAAIHISPDGKCLAASNRGHDSIALFPIGEDGTLAPPDFLMSGGEPRDFQFAPNGKWILSANQRDDSVTVYGMPGVNSERLTMAYDMPTPVCIVFGAR